MIDYKETVEKIAEAMWEDDSVRACGKGRMIPWAEVSPEERVKWVRFAMIAYAICNPMKVVEV